MLLFFLLWCQGSGLACLRWGHLASVDGSSWMMCPLFLGAFVFLLVASGFHTDFNSASGMGQNLASSTARDFCPAPFTLLTCTSMSIQPQVARTPCSYKNAQNPSGFSGHSCSSCSWWMNGTRCSKDLLGKIAQLWLLNILCMWITVPFWISSIICRQVKWLFL